MTMTEWINKRFGVAFADQDLSSVKDFSLYWNVFEDTVCGNNFNLETLEQSFQAKNFNRADFQSSIDYFRNRYVTDGKLNDKFPFLYFRNNDRQGFVEQVLLGQLDDTNNIILASAIIVYRFRNNLFHGLKDIRTINFQQDNFDAANNFLQSILNYY
jgi:hypothetical protein